MRKQDYNIKKGSKVLLLDHSKTHDWISAMLRTNRPVLDTESKSYWLPAQVKERHDDIVAELHKRFKYTKPHKTPIVLTKQLKRIEIKYKGDYSEPKIETWHELHKQIRKEAGRRKVVLGEGKKNRPIFLIIGEAPGREELAQGKPFVGMAGGYLNKVLQEVNVSRKDVYITNALKFRTSSMRPAIKEIAAQQKFLQAEIDLSRPKKVMALGRSAQIALGGLRIGFYKSPHPSTVRWLGEKVVSLMTKIFRRAKHA